MKRNLLLLLALIPILAFGTGITIQIDLPRPDYNPQTNSFDLRSASYGSISGIGKWQLPVKSVNILLPAGAELVSHSIELSAASSFSAKAPNLNSAFSSSDATLYASSAKSTGRAWSYRGLQKWGDLTYARFEILPASYDEAAQAYLWSDRATINLEYVPAQANSRNIIPPSLLESSFFANPEALSRWYRKTHSRNYDYLIVSTPQLYAAATDLESYHQAQGLITAFANINTILAETPGQNDAAKLRNYLIQEYQTNPFTYLLLIGDIDTVPIAMLTPEPDGFDTIPSDFYFSDLSSNFDTDNDGRLGEYSTGFGDQDYGVDFTPEIYVGRIAWNTASAVSTIASRIVAYDQSTAAWKNRALLPAAFLNYHQEEYNMDFTETDGAGFMEFIRDTIISGMESTTLYEQLGVVPSFPSDFDLDYDTLQNLISTESYGLLSWSAHGSATSSSRKIWMVDDNENNIPDSYEMQWENMVNRSSFDQITNPDGMVIFCASCYNGKIDHTSASLAEHALWRKGVAVIGATRTGWYKIGWRNPGWGGLSSYNYHFLENFQTFGMSVGASHSYANLLHTQYYLFGDPIDSGGIIWPELQNVYTYLLYGDPAVGHTPSEIELAGEILIWEPNHQDGTPIINAINALGNYNVVYTDKLIPDYEYLDNFEAVFCLFGYGDAAYQLQSNTLEYNLLNGYLDGGGRLYLEGQIAWDETDPFFAKFATSAPFDHIAHIEAIKHENADNIMIWDYISPITETQALHPTSATATTIFHSHNTEFANDVIGIFNTNGSYRTLASSFQLYGATEPDYSLVDMVSVIFDTLNVGIEGPVSNDDQNQAVPALQFSLYPNPFSEQIKLDLKSPGTYRIDIFNIRGQLVKSERLQYKASDIYSWDGKDTKAVQMPNGIYFVKVSKGSTSTVRKALMLR